MIDIFKTTTRGGGGSTIVNSGTAVAGSSALVFDPLEADWKPPIFDDWMAGANGAEPYGTMGWDSITNGSGGLNTPQIPSILERNRRGIIKITCGTAATNTGGYIANQSAYLLGGCDLVFAFDMRLDQTLDNGDFIYRIGLSNTWPGIQHGAIFEYTSSSIFWNAITTQGGTQTRTVCSTAVGTGFLNFAIVVTNSTKIDYYLNGVIAATHTTNIPTGVNQICGPTMFMEKRITGSSKSWYIDYTYERWKPLTRRGTWIPGS
jgi:hypothetical protein